MSSRYELACKDTLIMRLEEAAAELDSLQAAKKACIDIYMDLHVSEMKGKPEHLKQAWSVGNMLYIKKLEGKGDE